MQPYILKDRIKSPKVGKQIISTKTSETINLMLRKVVSLNEGTANFADIKGYEVGGKTGTSVKLSHLEGNSSTSSNLGIKEHFPSKENFLP